MAWSKTKTGVLIGVVLLVGGGAALIIHHVKDRREFAKDPIAYKVNHQPPVTDTEKLRSQLIGSWEMRGTRSWGATNVTYYPPNNGHIKTFTDTVSSTVYNDPDSTNTLFFCSGPYTLQGNNYTESLETATGWLAKFKGAHPRFKISVEGDTYYQMGAGKNPQIEEIWQRMKQ
jgi:hypothetical protein